MKFYSIIVDSIDYTFLQNKVSVTIPCDGVEIMGVRTVSAFNSKEEVERKVLFLLRYNQKVYGTEDYKTLDAYLQYRDSMCKPCIDSECGVMLNGCFLTLNGCTLN